jgi:predicted  nucleic acid-binding Zn-ribbon protein
MWNTITSNLPVSIVFIIAVIICGAELIKAIMVWRDARKKRNQAIIDEHQRELDIMEEFKKLHERLDGIEETITDLTTRMASAEETLKNLTISDMNDIKAWIVDQYHKFYTEQGWTDAFNADTLDKRYEDYKKEGGNSYIDTLMERLHSLPMDPPLKDRE